MNDLGVLIERVGFSPINTVLLLLIWLSIRKKIKEHDIMYEWYVGKIAIEKIVVAATILKPKDSDGL